MYRGDARNSAGTAKGVMTETSRHTRTRAELRMGVNVSVLPERTKVGGGDR